MPLNIVMISAHACIRVQKMALPLISDGHNVHLLAQKIPSFYEAYKSVGIYSDAGQLIEMIDTFEKSNKVDLYHCHNEPSWFVTLLKERTNKPVILDIHDSFLTRSTPEEDEAARAKGESPRRITAEERTNFQLADGLIFVSDEVKEVVAGEFKLSQPHLCLASYLPESWFKYSFGQWWGGLVYEGKVIRQSELNQSRSTGFQYCDYRDTAKQCKKTGVDFHLYAGNDDAELKGMYADSAFLHPGLPFRELLANVSRHDWGLVGNVNYAPQWQETLPNKLFEYMAAGVPPVAINAAASAKIIKENDIGMVVKDIFELAKRWKEHREKRLNMIKRRQDFAMERHIGRLEDFYRGFLW